MWERNSNRKAIGEGLRPSAIGYASDELQNDRSFSMQAALCSVEGLNFLSREMRNDKVILLGECGCPQFMLSCSGQNNGCNGMFTNCTKVDETFGWFLWGYLKILVAEQYPKLVFLMFPLVDWYLHVILNLVVSKVNNHHFTKLVLQEC